jgi:hypothetical protein
MPAGTFPHMNAPVFHVWNGVLLWIVLGTAIESDGKNARLLRWRFAPIPVWSKWLNPLAIFVLSYPLTRLFSSSNVFISLSISERHNNKDLCLLEVGMIPGSAIYDWSALLTYHPIIALCLIVLGRYSRTPTAELVCKKSCGWIDTFYEIRSHWCFRLAEFKRLQASNGLLAGLRGFERPTRTPKTRRATLPN